MKILRIILSMMLALLAYTQGAAQLHGSTTLSGMWWKPFSYKHNGEIFQGRFFLDFEVAGNRFQLIEMMQIGTRPDAFFIRYDGVWRCDGSELELEVNNQTGPMFAREIRDELAAAGLDASYIDELENSFTSSLPSVDKLGIVGRMTLREITPTRLALSDYRGSKQLEFRHSGGLPEVGKFKFEQSASVESKLKGSWRMKVDGVQYVISLTPSTHKLKGALIFDGTYDLKAEFAMLWQASRGALRLILIDQSVRITQGGEELAVDIEGTQELVRSLKSLAAVSQVFGLPIDLSGDRLSVYNLVGKRRVFTKVADLAQSNSNKSTGSNQVDNSVNTKSVQSKNSSVGKSNQTNIEKDRVEPTSAQPIREEVFTAVEEMPQFPGGQEALLSTINSLIQYPAAAAESNISGRVVLKFVVHSNGSIGDVVVIRGLGPELDQEAIRVVKQLPKFEPGRMNGTAVAVWYTLPIEFKTPPHPPKTTW